MKKRENEFDPLGEERLDMRLKCFNLPTMDVPKMRDFYQTVLKASCREFCGRCEIDADNFTLVLTATKIPPVIHPESCGMEFSVEDVDDEYRRLLESGVIIDSPPVTYPWGFRAIGFRDPDGNHIDFVQQVGAPADDN